MSLFYAPAYTDEGGQISPGQDTGSGIEAPGGPYAPGTTSLKYDESIPRFILTSDSLLPGWVEKTEAEITADYPDIVFTGSE